MQQHWLVFAKHQLLLVSKQQYHALIAFLLLRTIIVNCHIKNLYLYSMANIIHHIVVDRFPYVTHRTLRISWSDDFMGSRGVFIGCQDANLPSCYLLLVYIHCL